MSIFKQAKFSDGEGIDYTDFNALSEYIRSQHLDTLGAEARLVASDIVPATNGWLWCRGNAGAVTPNASFRTLTNLAGPVYQQIASVDGTTPAFLAYYLAADELLTQFAVGDPSNPRWDILCVKLSMIDGPNVSRDFKDAVTGVVTSQNMPVIRAPKIDIQVVGGTPAGSPVEPATPAGYVKIAAVKISANQTTSVIASTNVVDCRMPIGLQIVDVYGRDAVQLAAGWATGTGTDITSTGTPSPTSLLMSPPISGYVGRVSRIALISSVPVGVAPAVTIGWFDLMASTLNFTSLKDVTANLIHAAAGRWVMEVDLSTFPIWLTGQQAPQIAPLIGGEGAGVFTSSLGSMPKMALRFQSNQANDTVVAARFFVAGGG